MTMVKSHVKKLSTLFSYDYDHYNVVKCRQDLNFEKMGTAPYTEKIDGFWLLWGIFKEYIKQNNMVVLTKTNAHSVVICRLIKNQYNCK